MRPLSLRILPLSGLASALALACSSQAPDAPQAESLGATSSAIINGSLDTTHQAVVTLGSNQGLCTGTIVKTDVENHIGWVLTAAHCVDTPPVIVIQGDDFMSPTRLQYDVIDYKADPEYTGENGFFNDFAVVRIAGVDASTPKIPITSSPDGLATGTAVTSVGYGRISGDLNGPDNTKRRSVQKTLNQVNGDHIRYSIASSGICNGDSGGPVLVGTGANERVVGVHSYVTGSPQATQCNGTGSSGRVSVAGAAFIAGELAKAAPAASCALCKKIANSGKSVCAEMTSACLADEDCRGYYTCLNEGKAEADCIKAHPLAEGPFNATQSCVCTTACVDECQGTSACNGVPKCGYHIDNSDCSKCVENVCCAEETECAADGQCYICLKDDDKDPKCATNAKRKKLADCAATKCKTDCADAPVSEGGEDPADPDGDGVTDPQGEGGEEEAPAAAPKTTTVTKEGCAMTPGSSSSSSSGAMMLGLALTSAAVFARRRRQG